MDNAGRRIQGKDAAWDRFSVEPQGGGTFASWCLTSSLASGCTRWDKKRSVVVDSIKMAAAKQADGGR